MVIAARSWDRLPDVSVNQIPPNRQWNVDLGPAFVTPLERDFAALLEFDETVLGYDEIPVQVAFTDRDGRRRATAAGVLVSFDQRRVPNRRPCLYRIAHDRELRARWADLKPGLLAGSRYAKEQGWDWAIWTDYHVYTPYFANARFLLPYARYAPNPDDAKLLLEILFELHTISPQGLLAAIYSDPWNQAQLIPTLWNLVGTRRISVDFDQPLTMASPLRLPEPFEV